MKNKNIFIAVIILLLFFLVNSVFSQQELSRKHKRIYKHAEKLNKNKQFDKALGLFFMVEKDIPSHIETLKNIADIYYKNLKNYSEAIVYYNKALKLLYEHIEEINKATKVKKKEKKYYNRLKEQCKNRKISCDLLLGNEPIKNKQQIINENIKPINEVDKNENESYIPLQEEDENLITIDTALSENIIDYDKYEFRTNLIDISNLTETEQLDTVKAIVIRYYNRFLEENSLDIHSENDIQNINKKWLQQTMYTDYQWFDNFKQLENKYLNQLLKLNEKKQKINELTIRYDNVKNELKYYTERKDNLVSRKELLENTKNNVLKNQLYSKLSTVPQSIVLIGRTALRAGVSGGEDKTSFERLDKAMKSKALENIKGYNISRVTLQTDDNIQQIFKKSMTGTVQTKNKYFGDIIIDLGNNKYQYSILRMEVMVFENKNIQQNRDTTSNLSDTTISVYSYNNSSNEFLNLYNNNITHQEELRLNIKVIDYLKDMNEFSELFNKKYQKKIDDALVDYQCQKEEYINKINAVKDEIKNIKETIAEKKTNKKDLEDLLRLNNDEKNRIDNLVTQYKNEYHNFVNNKISYTNQLTELDATTTRRSASADFSSLAEKCYNEIYNLKMNNINVTLYKDFNAQTYKYNETDISLYPKYNKFRILSINKLGTDDYKTYYYLNLAFEISWKKYEKEFETQSQPPRIFQVVNVNDTIEWRLSSLGSIRAYIVNNEPNWVLPTALELSNMFEKIQYLINNNSNFYENISELEWPKNNQFYLTSNKNEQNENKCVKFIETGNFSNKFINDMDMINIIEYSKIEN